MLLCCCFYCCCCFFCCYYCLCAFFLNIYICLTFSTHFYSIEMHALFDRKWKKTQTKKQIDIAHIQTLTRTLVHTTYTSRISTYAHVQKLNPIHFRDYFFSVLSYVIRLIVSQSLVKNVTFFVCACVFIVVDVLLLLLLFSVGYPDSFRFEWEPNMYVYTSIAFAFTCGIVLQFRLSNLHVFDLLYFLAYLMYVFVCSCYGINKAVRQIAFSYVYILYMCPCFHCVFVWCVWFLTKI